jgi:hypothetical protein
VALDGLLGDEQRLGDLAIGHPLRSHLRDPKFGGGQALCAGLCRSTWSRAGGDQAIQSIALDRRRSSLPGEILSFGEQASGLLVVALLVKQAAEIDEAPSLLEASFRGSQDSH